jgi:sec-independent protein translocase protein TatC
MPLDQIDVDALPDDAHEMSFFDHIDELRGHIIRSVIAIMVVTIGVFAAKDFVFGTIIFGPKNPDFITYRVLCWFSHFIGAGEKICITPTPFDVQGVDIGEAFTLHITASMVLGIIVSFPYIFWEVWRFVRPGMRRKEATSTFTLIAVCSLLFFFGVAFGYFVIAPSGINFLAGYNLPGVVNQPRISSYVNYLILFVLPTGITFEMPVVVYFLAQLGIVSADGMRSWRRYAIVIILIVAAIITPGPDIMSQLLVGVPLYVLYEASVGIAAREDKKRAQRELLAETEGL